MSESISVDIEMEKVFEEEEKQRKASNVLYWLTIEVYLDIASHEKWFW